MLFSDSLYLILLSQPELKVNTLGMYFFLWTDYSGTWARYFFEFFIINQQTLYIGENSIVLYPQIGGVKLGSST